ncbi:YokU family protein [Fredinandcohnia sp. QZ13]|uniref:YokU family protein n=1 Tax=Fredinandcohnia sp. QZ13 TaxID=3073144 RepID=UPI00285333FF|nr:YokU family protein [Fredinandcohnia sp. QZ13]MDR4886096.1 YokU family protein [Fredinandcohnia sp. QZ13]
MKCMWCESEKAREATNSVFWELPDGTRAIEITEIPSVRCEACGMEYQEEDIINEIEDQLMLIDTKKLSKAIQYKELMKIPRFLKHNYFRF